MQPLDFQLRPSLILQRVVILSWLTLVIICVTADLPWWQSANLYITLSMALGYLLAPLCAIANDQQFAANTY